MVVPHLLSFVTFGYFQHLLSENLNGILKTKMKKQKQKPKKGSGVQSKTGISFHCFLLHQSSNFTFPHHPPLSNQNT
jgi:hypothetical protein